MLGVLFFALVASAKAEYGAYDKYLAYCRSSIEQRNGVGYYENPDDCKSYLQCDMDEYGQVQVHEKTCADGTLFDSDVVSCVPCEIAQCHRSKLLGPKCPPMTPPPTTTESYTTLPQFDGKCEGPHGWTYLAVWGDPSIFYRTQVLGDETRIERVSCGQWEFNVQRCMCMAPDLRPIALWPFDESTDTTVDNFWTDCTGVKLGQGRIGYAAQFNGTVHCEIPRFNNYPWGSSFTISFWYETAENSYNVRDGLISNGNCLTEPTIALWTERGYLGGRVLIDNNQTLLTIDLGGSHGGKGWNHVVLSYDGLRLKLFVNGYAAKDEIAVGHIPATLSPLYLGRGTSCEAKDYHVNNHNLMGSLDEVGKLCSAVF
ncbi:uncharacterized protein LOC106151681 [Lingula anatina]|uniref:Uncharacterized protein LOC106151681 n=1 Tax=Lingula anatina TaxID=7574 RepID=A0A1S3H2Z7_LINAN|nr:uncharacterized protein LOC106151681 [Lingula anatina]|eukprot:XP_013380505.1 uncharacterized protein LOC106151681 [Lingula anatina]